MNAALTHRLLSVLASLSLCIISSSAAIGQAKIVEMSIACSNDHVYTWYSDRTISVGTSENLAAYEPPHSYSLPFGKTPDDIVGIGIAGDDRVYTWYSDSTVSVGTSTDLDKYQPRHPYRAAFQQSSGSILAMDIACSNDHVYAWYRTGSVSSGTSVDLDKYNHGSRFVTGSTASITIVRGIGIAHDDHVYVWYSNGAVSSGTSEDFVTYRRPYEYIVGPGPCDISVDAPKLNGRVISFVGIRGPECKSSAEIIVRLLEIIPGLPDLNLFESRRTGTNFEQPITYKCRGQQQQKIVTEISSKGRHVRSAEVTIPNCF